MLDTITTAVGNAGLLTIYSGTQPAGGGTATTQLAQLTCGTPFAASAAAGVLTLGGLVADSAADATGNATWFRVTTSAGVFCMDGDISSTAVGTGDLQLDSVAIVLNGIVNLSGPNTITAPNAA
jgi:hypothetical protein